MLYGLCVSWLTAVTMTVVHDRVPGIVLLSLISWLTAVIMTVVHDRVPGIVLLFFSYL